MNSTLFDYLLPLVLIAALLLLANPFHFWMPGTLHMIVLVLVVILFVIFSTFIWHERAADEREQVHRNIAGRFAFMTFTSVAVGGIIVQTLNHTLDIWLVATLVAGIIAKVASIVYVRKNN